MLTDVVADVFSQILFASRVPLTAAQISHILDECISVEAAELVLERIRREARVYVWAGHYLLVGSEDAMRCNILVSTEYQLLGMSVLTVDGPPISGSRGGHHSGAYSPLSAGGVWNSPVVTVPYILRNAEHRFFTVRPSTLGREAGYGLFLRETRYIRQGTILCEYVGRVAATLPKSLEWGPYVVRLRGVERFVDGVDHDGNYLCYAALINDSGPVRANAEMREYDMHPGRVFVVALRDIHPGEELFVTYGSGYWGLRSYAERNGGERAGKKGSRHGVNGPGSKRRREKNGHLMKFKSASTDSDEYEDDEDEDDDADYFEVTYQPLCRACGEVLPQLLKQLHRECCGDPLSHRQLRNLNSLPMNDFTIMPTECRICNSSRQSAFRTASFFVCLSEPQTFALSHEDVVGSFEFTWE